MIDLAIVNGVIISSTDSGDASHLPRMTVLVHNGKIEGLLQPHAPFDAAQVLEIDGMFVMPGVIDIHFHSKGDAFENRGNFLSETKAAAAGGITTVFEMPISKPATSTLEVWERRREVAEREAYVNVALYAAPGHCDADEIKAMAEAGAIGFKLLLTKSPPGREAEFLGVTASNLAEVVQALELIRETGRRCVFHAEDQPLLDLYTARSLMSQNPDYKRHRLSRPSIVESTAVAALVAVARALNTPIHIAHVSSHAAIEWIRAGRELGAPVSSETCPHYLFFTDDVLEEIGAYGRINPPMRGKEDQEALWQALKTGVIDVVATDHAPFTVDEKEEGHGRILNAPPGHPGVEAMVSMIMTAALESRITLSQVVELLSTRPAQLFDLFPRKGSLQPGADADITIYDPRTKHQIDRRTWRSRAAGSNYLYHGVSTSGRVYATLVSGKVVYQDGEIVGQPGDGRIVRPGT